MIKQSVNIVKTAVIPPRTMVHARPMSYKIGTFPQGHPLHDNKKHMTAIESSLFHSRLPTPLNRLTHLGVGKEKNAASGDVIKIYEVSPVSATGKIDPKGPQNIAETNKTIKNEDYDSFEIRHELSPNFDDGTHNCDQLNKILGHKSKIIDEGF